MATRTRTGNRVTSTPVFKSKSDAFRDLLRNGINPETKSPYMISDAAAKIGIGYAFAYGIAKRAGLAETKAKRKATKKVAVNADGSVTIQTSAGPVTVAADGTVTRPRATKAK